MMQKSDNEFNLAKRWLDYAFDDLKLAKVALREDLPHFACFHAQQAAEKALKGLMVLRTGTVRKVHDLLELLDALVKYNTEISALKHHCEVLNRYYSPVRYPDALPGSLPTGLPNKNDAKGAIGLADEILKFIQDLCKMKF